MNIKADWLRDMCDGLVRELSRLSQLNRPLSLDDFYDLAEKEIFIETLFKRYGNYIVGLQYLDADSEHCDVVITEFLENAFARHINVVTPETYGVVDNAYLLAINITVAISREADEM